MNKTAHTKTTGGPGELIKMKGHSKGYLGDILGLASAALGGLTWETDSRLSDTSASVGIR